MSSPFKGPMRNRIHLAKKIFFCTNLDPVRIAPFRYFLEILLENFISFWILANLELLIFHF